MPKGKGFTAHLVKPACGLGAAGSSYDDSPGAYSYGELGRS